MCWVVLGTAHVRFTSSYPSRVRKHWCPLDQSCMMRSKTCARLPTVEVNVRSVRYDVSRRNLTDDHGGGVARNYKKIHATRQHEHFTNKTSQRRRKQLGQGFLTWQRPIAFIGGTTASSPAKRQRRRRQRPALPEQSQVARTAAAAAAAAATTTTANVRSPLIAAVMKMMTLKGTTRSRSCFGILLGARNFLCAPRPSCVASIDNVEDRAPRGCFESPVGRVSSSWPPPLSWPFAFSTTGHRRTHPSLTLGRRW